MNILIALILIAVSFYLLFLVTQKQRSKPHKLSPLLKNIFLVRTIAYLFMLISVFLLCTKFGFGIGCVSFLVFMSPIIFFIIMCVNSLSPDKKNTAFPKSTNKL